MDKVTADLDKAEARFTLKPGQALDVAKVREAITKAGYKPTWLAAVFFVLWVVERRKGSAPGASATPLEILKARYARGEIDRQEFEERRRDLL